MKKEMTPAELEVMRAVWNVIEEGKVANTRSVRKKVNERREDKLYGQVVYCHIEHLQQKGYVKVMRTEEGDRYYVPLMEKREFMEKQARVGFSLCAILLGFFQKSKNRFLGLFLNLLFTSLLDLRLHQLLLDF